MPHAALPAPALRAVWRSLTAIPGVVPEASELVPPDADGPADLVLTVKGWSPTLHHCSMQWRVPINVRDETLASDILDGLQERLETQRRRAASAERHGLGLPADVRWKEGWRHLHADLSHLACQIHAKTEGRDSVWQEIDSFDSPELTRELLKDALGSLQLAHGDDRPYEGGPVVKGSGCMGVEVDGMHVVKLSSASMVGCDRRKFSLRHGFDGETLLSVSDALLPDSVVGALPGRTVGDVVFLHRFVNDRRIASARSRGSDLELALEPEYVAFADLADLDARQALKLLEERARNGNAA